MTWIQLELLTEREAAPLLEAALENAGALAVTLDDGGGALGSTERRPAHHAQVLEPAPGATPLWRQLRMTALFDDDPAGQMQAESAASALAGQCLAAPQLSRLDDRPWERVWLEDLHPQRFGERLWVCPRGQTVDAPDAVVIDLDPGLAFGTGHHATTALCLEWLDRTALRGKTLIDFGCGSGILAIAALRLGAARAIAVDHDPLALEATLENAAINGVAANISVHLPEDIAAKPDDYTSDLVIANILAQPLIELAPILTRLARPAAQLALSGVLDHQASAVCMAYSDSFRLDAPGEREGWALISGRRR